MDVDDPFDGVLPLTSPVSLPKSPDISNGDTVASPTNNQPIAGPSKDPQPGPSTAATNTPKTTQTTRKKTTPKTTPVTPGARKSPRNTTPNQTFTRRRDKVNPTPAPPEYLPKSKVKNMNWKKGQFFENSPPFTGDTTLPQKFQNLETLWQFFNYFFTPELVEKIRDETVTYASEKNINKPLALKVDEIYRFLGVSILSSIIHLPNLRNYWSPTIGVDPIRNSMPVNRFEKIKQFLHFNDNKILTSDDPIHATQQSDRLFKLRPLIDSLLERFQTIPPAEKLSLDEQVCATKNKTYLKNYLSNKPHKWGYKLYVLSDTMGYVHNFEVYTGADEIFLPNEPNLGAAGNTVMRLCRILPDGKNYKLYFDNYYSSIPLAVYLYHRGILVLGTINRNRIPDRFYIPQSDVQKMMEEKREEGQQKTHRKYRNQNQKNQNFLFLLLIL